MYYAGLRPEEAINLDADNVILPPQVWDEDSQQRRDPPDDQDWGELHIRSATPDVGSDWTDDGSPRERRQLKHRAEGDSRIVPTHPELTWLLRHHLAQFGTASDGGLFAGVRGDLGIYAMIKVLVGLLVTVAGGGRSPTDGQCRGRAPRG